MKYSLAAIAAVSLLSLNAIANSGSLKATITILNAKVIGESQNRDSHSYLLTKLSSKYVQEVVGSGAFANHHEVTNSEKNVTMGVEVKGYTQIKLKDKGNGKLIVSTDNDLTTFESNISFHVAYKIDSEATITKGSFASYLKGEQIEYRLTKKSLEKIAKLESKTFAQSFEVSLLEGLKAAGHNPSVSSNVEAVTTTEDGQLCKATLEKLECFVDKAQYIIDMSIRI